MIGKVNTVNTSKISSDFEDYNFVRTRVFAENIHLKGQS